jgi:hypothetical protein
MECLGHLVGEWKLILNKTWEKCYVEWFVGFHCVRSGASEGNNEKWISTHTRARARTHTHSHTHTHTHMYMRVYQGNY